MRSRRTRSLLVSAFVLALAGVGWFFLAPTQIGGSTRYVITHGISMEPLIHTGISCLVRPASDYHVGEVVAYHSTLLNTVVLHRIVAIHHGHYTFKGDNNSFLDPTHPTRALLLGRMWLHIPQGGAVLDWVHKPWVAARSPEAWRCCCSSVASSNVGDAGGAEPGKGRSPPARAAQGELRATWPIGRFWSCRSWARCFSPRSGCSRSCDPPAARTVAAPRTPSSLSFGYRGLAKPGSVYPGGTVTTGDPVYLQLVHRFAVTASYEFKTSATGQLHGSVRIRGTLSNESGWSRGFWLNPQTHFSSNHASATAQIDLSRLQALTSRVSAQIGGGGVYTLAIVPQVKLSGTVGGAPLTTTDSAALDLTFGASALASGTSAITSSTPAAGGPSAGSAAGSAQSGLVHTSAGSLLSASSTTTNELGGVPVRTVRWIALAAFTLFALLALLTGSRELRGSSDPVEQINHRYRHLIVPVSSITTDPEHPPIEVRTIEALAHLAERSERLILHDHQDDVDNYLIDDQGTLFRFQALRIHTQTETGTATEMANTVRARGDEPVPVGVAPPRRARDGAGRTAEAAR